jgi:hypothetical protein
VANDRIYNSTNTSPIIRFYRVCVMKKHIAIGSIILIVVAGLLICLAKGVFSGVTTNLNLDNQSNKTPDNSQYKSTADENATGTGIAAMREAAKAKQYLFAFFWKAKNDQTGDMSKILDAAMKKADVRARSVRVCITDPNEKGIVDKFGLDRAPMPLVLAIAPNGAVMGGFPTKFTEEELLNAFSTPCTERCMKAMQEGKLVFLCVQNDATKNNDEALNGVREFKKDERYAKFTEVVMLDPSDAAETPFLADLKIDPKVPEAVTAFMAPPGSVIAEFKGATVKDELIAALQKASTGCGPGGCGPGGCGPKQ